jgi:DNA-binding transcriptional MerR regulator
MMGKRGRGRGRTRRYSFGDVVLLRTYARLLEQGISIKRLKEAVGTWSRHFKRLDHQEPPAKYLLTDGKNVFFIDKDNVITDLTNNGQISFSFIIDIQNIYHDVQYRVSRLYA